MDTQDILAHERAIHLRQIICMYLIRKAFRGQTTTYEEIATEFGLPRTGNALGSTLSPILGKIFRWCEVTRQPHLTSIVVRKSGGDANLPGAGFWALAGLQHIERTEKRSLTRQYHEEVFEYYKKLSE